MDLNDYRNEAGDFLRKLNINDSDDKYLSMLKEELDILSDAALDNNEEKL